MTLPPVRNRCKTPTLAYRPRAFVAYRQQSEIERCRRSGGITRKHKGTLDRAACWRTRHQSGVMRTRGASSTHCGSPMTARKVSGEFARASLMECRNSTTKLRISSDYPPIAPYHTSKDAQGGLVTSTLRSNVSNSPILLRAMRSNAAIQMRAILGASFTTTKRGGRAAYRADRRELRLRPRTWWKLRGARAMRSASSRAA